MLICLMMWTMWCLGGLNRCRYRPNDVAHFLDNPHTLAVEGKGITHNKAQVAQRIVTTWVKQVWYLY